MSENKYSGLAGGLLIGMLVGAIAGLFYAPRSGRETREDLSGKAKDLACKLQGEYDGALEKGKIAYDKLLVRLRDLEAKAERKAKDLKGGSGVPA
jgi:gas vesicle protein